MAAFDIDVAFRNGRIVVCDNSGFLLGEIPWPGNEEGLTKFFGVSKEFSSVTDEDVPLPDITNAKVLIINTDGLATINIDGASGSDIPVNGLFFLQGGSSSGIADGDLKITTTSAVRATILAVE